MEMCARRLWECVIADANPPGNPTIAAMNVDTTLTFTANQCRKCVNASTVLFNRSNNFQSPMKISFDRTSAVRSEIIARNFRFNFEAWLINVVLNQHDWSTTPCTYYHFLCHICFFLARKIAWNTHVSHRKWTEAKDKNFWGNEKRRFLFYSLSLPFEELNQYDASCNKLHCDRIYTRVYMFMWHDVRPLFTPQELKRKRKRNCL